MAAEQKLAQLQMQYGLFVGSIPSSHFVEMQRCFPLFGHHSAGTFKDGQVVFFDDLNINGFPFSSSCTIEKDGLVTQATQSSTFLKGSDGSVAHGKVSQKLKHSDTPGKSDEIEVKLLLNNPQNRDSSPYFLYATHTIVDHQVQNDVRIETRPPNYYEGTEPKIIYIFDDKNKTWTQYTQTNKDQHPLVVKRDISSEDLINSKVDCVPSAIDINGNLMTLMMKINGEITVFTVPTEVPGDVMNNFLNKKPMIPYKIEVMY